MTENTSDAPKSPESLSSSPETQIVDGTRGNTTAALESLYDGVVTAQQLIGNEPGFMDFDPDLVALDVAKRHGGDSGLGDAIRGWRQNELLQ